MLMGSADAAVLMWRNWGASLGMGSGGSASSRYGLARQAACHLKSAVPRSRSSTAALMSRSAAGTPLCHAPCASLQDVDAVVGTCHAAGISRKVVRLRPIAVIKG